MFPYVGVCGNPVRTECGNVCVVTTRSTDPFFILILDRRKTAPPPSFLSTTGAKIVTDYMVHNTLLYASSAALPRVSVTVALSLSEQRVLAMRCTSLPPPSEARSKCWCPANSASSAGL